MWRLLRMQGSPFHQRTLCLLSLLFLHCFNLSFCSRCFCSCFNHAFFYFCLVCLFMSLYVCPWLALLFPLLLRSLSSLSPFSVFHFLMSHFALHLCLFLHRILLVFRLSFIRWPSVSDIVGFTLSSLLKIYMLLWTESEYPRTSVFFCSLDFWLSVQILWFWDSWLQGSYVLWILHQGVINWTSSSVLKIYWTYWIYWTACFLYPSANG